MGKATSLRIVIASGKGGTGKTTVATSLALSLTKQEKVEFLDCDVEAPNAHLFLHPTLDVQKDAVILIPQIQPDRCQLCGTCVEVCQFHALAKIADHILVFPQLCHGCGSCTWNCPQKAIEEVGNPIGVLESGLTKTGIQFAQGKLTISEPMPTPVIRQLKHWSQPQYGSIQIVDAPPGASCSVVETLQGADFALLVTEPTPFGLHDLKQVLGILQSMHVPAGVVINRDGIGDDQVESFLLENNIPILMRIPYAAEIAEAIASGHTLLDVSHDYGDSLREMFKFIKKSVSESAPC